MRCVLSSIHLSELGFRPFLQEVLDQIVKPLAAVALPEWGSQSLDSMHAFTIRYEQGKDKDLDLHMDLSEVTLNCCLGKEGFAGAELYFRGQRDLPSSIEGANDRTSSSDVPGTYTLTHTIGHGVLHAGQVHTSSSPIYTRTSTHFT